jgi:hypothetical protein
MFFITKLIVSDLTTDHISEQANHEVLVLSTEFLEEVDLSLHMFVLYGVLDDYFLRLNVELLS